MDNNTSADFSVDEDGDGFFTGAGSKGGNGTLTGEVTAAGFKDAVRRRDGSLVSASVPLAPGPQSKILAQRT
jgi:hypothetical protein